MKRKKYYNMPIIEVTLLSKRNFIFMSVGSVFNWEDNQLDDGTGNDFWGVN